MSHLTTRFALAALLLAATANASAYDRYRPPLYPSRPSPNYCADYARDYVRWEGERGGAAQGAVGGAVGGAIIGGLVNGKRGARRGARAGAVVGAVRGSREQRRDNAWLFERAYDDCMYHHGR